MREHFTRVLCIDEGNTRTKWGVFDTWPQPVCHEKSLGVQASIELDSEQAVTAWFERLHPDWLALGVQAVGLCSVRQGPLERTLRALLVLHHLAFFTVTPNTGSCLRTRYAQPLQLGQDRWAACLAVSHRTQNPYNLVLGLGTATTADALVQTSRQTLMTHVTVPWVHWGGVIFPGVNTMFESLSRNTARLPRANWKGFQDWPVDTESAIASGIAHAQVDTILRLQEKLEVTVDAPVQLWLSGGFAKNLADVLEGTAQVLDHAVLWGVLDSHRDCPGELEP